MKILSLLLFITLSFSLSAQNDGFSIVLHGGAGYITPENLSESKQIAYQSSLSNALALGTQILERGGTSEEAVITVIIFLENDTLFNAGRGAVLTHDNKVSHDASIMNGSDLNAGAIAGSSRIKNPIRGAAAVKDFSEHVFLSGNGAEEFAELQSLEMVPPDYFILQSRLDQLDKILKNENKSSGYILDPIVGNGKFGTVGCVALDTDGNITAATSTGGMMNKKYGRIGDSPMIGAGTYANNKTCGVSCTGHGEYFIRVGVAKEISDQIQFGQVPLKDAVHYTISESLNNLNGKGGVIAIDSLGEIVIEFNTPGMFRAWQKAGEEPQIQMFK